MDVVVRWLVKQGFFFTIGFVVGTLIFTEGERTRTALYYGVISVWGFIFVTLVTTYFARD